MFTKAEWAKERKWLAQILSIIESQLARSEEQAKKFRAKVLTLNKDMWKDTSAPTGDYETDLDMVIQINQFLKERRVQIINKNFYNIQANRLKKMHQSPYFARLTFIEDAKNEIEYIYIGIATLLNESDNCLIYDWRAPISSMFYDYQPGRAEYDTPIGSIKGEILLKRQYRIIQSQLQYMFDTNIKIDDEILQKILAQNASGKMKHIVTSIQQEQNKVIRDDEHTLLIVQGSAGSGKTSIALHRIAYLLYKYRNTINSDNILIFSPNQIFSDYISNVLPELGEENMLQVTFQEYAEDVLGNQFVVEDLQTQFEYFLNKPEDKTAYQIRFNGARYKASSDYVQVIKHYIQLIEQTKIHFEDLICQDEIIVSREELERIWRNSNYLPFAKALRKIKRRFVYRLKPFKKRRFKQLFTGLGKMPGYTMEQKVRLCMTKMREEIRPVKQKVDQMLSYNIPEMYLDLFKDRELFLQLSQDTIIPDNFDLICTQTLNSFARGIIPHEDVTPLLYFKETLQGNHNIRKGIKYVLIDEAQDYSAFQYEIFKKLFPGSNLTLLGDMNQSIYSYMGINDYQSIAAILGTESVKMINLKNSYRSTADITNFAKSILKTEQNINAVNRQGDKPEIIHIPDKESVKMVLINGLKNCFDKKYKSIAIICKTAALSEKIYNLLKTDIDIQLINKDDQKLTREVPVIIPSYLSKGLEFDGVLVYTDGENNYLQNEEINLLYTVCTRALHSLNLYYTDELSPFLVELRTNPS